MSSSGSTRDLTKAVHAFIATPSLPLPDNLTRVIEAYLDKHAEYDQPTSDRLQDDLLATFNRSVHNQRPLYYASFLAILRRLRPAIRSTTYILQWWEKMIEPAFDHLSDERGPSGEVLSDIGQFLVPDDEDNDNEEGGGAQDTNKDAAPYAIGHRLMQKWMDVYRAVLAEGYSTGWTKERPIQDILVLFGRRKPKAFFHVLNDFFVQKCYRTRSISLLSELIRSQPPHLHLVVKSPLFESLLRCLQHDTSTTVVSLALTCLTMLLPNMPGSIVPYLPALFNIYARILFWDREQLNTEEFGSVGSPAEPSSAHQVWERCTYSPEIDGLSIPHLLGYFNVLYGLYPLNFMDYIRKPQRYIRHANAMDTDDVEVQPSEIRDRSEKFRRCHMLHPNFYSLTIESEKTDFGRWMRSATADVVAECVSLHIPIDEMSAPRGDNTSQRNAISADFPVASERGSGVGLPSDLPVGDATEDDPLLSRAANGARLSASTGLASLSGSSRDPSAIRRRSSQSSHPSDVRRDSGADSPTLPPLLSQSASRADLQDMINSNKAIKTSLYQALANDSVPSLSLSHQESVPEKLASASKVSLRPPSVNAPSPLHRLDNADDENSDPPNEDTLTEMRRQILLLKNDLSFERYMVQQHLAHIGALRRSNVRQAVTEAETQNLILANRTLKHRLEEAKKTETQVKKEAEMSRNRSKSWEESLANKLKKLREEQKKWTADEGALRRDLNNTQADGARLLALVCEAEVRELKAKQDMQMLESAAAEMDKLKEEVKVLTAAKRESQKLEEQLEQTQEEAAKLESTLELLQMKLEARESELVRTRDYYQQQVVILNSKLTEVLRDGRPENITSTAETRAQVDSVLAASRAKHLELQKNHTRLMRKYKVLESKSLERATMYDDLGYAGQRGDLHSTLSDPEMETSLAFRTQPPGARGNTGAASSVGSAGSGGAAFRNRQRVASDAGSFDATSPISWAAPVSTSLGSAVSSPSTVLRRPSTPPGSLPVGSSRTETPGSTSPQAERYHGRGGVQNSIRKDRKDKKSDEVGDKKDKKPSGSGIRGIRGFV